MKNYFSLFDLPVEFSLDISTLTQTFLQLQQAVHPDHFSAESDQMQRMAVQQTAELNDAYHTLKSPLRRAEYMLALSGTDLAGEQVTLQDPAFLMQQMEWREHLEVLEQAQDLDGLGEFEQQIQTELKQMLHLVGTALDRGEALSNADKLAHNVRKLKFMYKLVDEIQRLEETLDDLI